MAMMNRLDNLIDKHDYLRNLFYNYFFKNVKLLFWLSARYAVSNLYMYPPPPPPVPPAKKYVLIYHLFFTDALHFKIFSILYYSQEKTLVV